MLTKTGEGRRLEFGIHWMAATVPVESGLDVDTSLGFIATELDGADWTVEERGHNGYWKTYTTLFGLTVYVNEERPEMGVHLVADGQCCEAPGAEHLGRIYLGLQMRATRIDLAVDNCHFSPQDLRNEWHLDNVRTACKPMRNLLPGREGIRTCSWYSSPTGDTFNMGSRKASAFARCYNERGFTRFELELKGERAAAVVPLVLEGRQGGLAVAVSVIRDFVDFVDASASANRTRCPPLPFWGEFVTEIEKANLRIRPRPEPTIQRTIDWIEGQVARSLVIYETYMRQLFDSPKEQVHRRLRRI